MDPLDLAVATEKWALLVLLDLLDLLDPLELLVVDSTLSASLFRRRPLIPSVVATALMTLTCSVIVTRRLTPPSRP